MRISDWSSDVCSSDLAEIKEPESEWNDSTEKDEMRGTTSRFAQLDAANMINLDFPYGEQRGRIVVRQSAQFGFDILVGVPSGQRSEEHTSELQSLMRISYAVFCLKKKNTQYHHTNYIIHTKTGYKRE